MTDEPPRNTIKAAVMNSPDPEAVAAAVEAQIQQSTRNVEEARALLEKVTARLDAAQGTESRDEKDVARKERTLRRSIARAQLPALYVDTWGTHTWVGHIRIALGEAFGGETGTVYRSAFVMTLDDAESFATDLLEYVKKRRKVDLDASEDED